MNRAALAKEACVPCRADSPGAGAAEASALLAALPDWRIVVADGIERLTRAFAVPDFAAALALAGRVGALAEAADHHPLIVVEWGRTTVQWWTHAIGGLHRNDFILAARCDALASGDEDGEAAD